MTGQLVRPRGQPAALVKRTVERAREYASRARAPNTRRAYRLHVARYRRYCAEYGLPASEPQTVALYLTDRADGGASLSAMAQALSALCEVAKKEGWRTSPRLEPVVSETWQGIRRTVDAQQRQASPVSPAQLRDMSRTLPPGLAGTRDRALLVLGFAGAFRRSELVALNVGDVEHVEEGIIIHIGRSKTDPEGVGRDVGLPLCSDPLTCPVRALAAWTLASGIGAGALFRGVRHGRLTGKRLDGKDVSRVLWRAACRCGLSLPTLSSHSLRAGLVTTALKAGKPIHVIQAQTGHKSAAMVYHYGRTIGLFDDNAAAGIGL